MGRAIFSYSLLKSKAYAIVALRIVWSKKNGDDLKKIVTERFASSTVFLSLLFSSEMGVLYSPSDPGKDIRAALESKNYDSPDYWLGVALCFAIFFSVSGTLSIGC